MSDDKQQPSPSSLRRRMTAKLESSQEAAKLQRQVTSNPLTIGTAGESTLELEWEEWDGTGSYLTHCLAGSFAGLVEHTALYPLDTIKTQMQAYCVDCPHQATCDEAAGVVSKAATKETTTATTMTPRFGRLWRGVQAMIIGCLPAHALYFSSYELVKGIFLSQENNSDTGEQAQKNLEPAGAAIAGATAAFCHDLVMTPADTIKQRLQLGHYHGMTDAVRSILTTEGPAGLYRSFAVTLLTNLPYGMIMVSTNEYLREVLSKRSNSTYLDVKTTMLAGCGAGMVAAAATTPLDRVKTRLQTQGLGTIVNGSSSGGSGIVPPPNCPKVAQVSAVGDDTAMALSTTRAKPKYQGLVDAFQSIVREEGWIGLFRGMTPRLMTHTPAIAISWTTYETAKMWLMSQ